jgi:hypothetical protein
VPYITLLSDQADDREAVNSAKRSDANSTQPFWFDWFFQLISISTHKITLHTAIDSHALISREHCKDTQKHKWRQRYQSKIASMSEFSFWLELIMCRRAFNPGKVFPLCVETGLFNSTRTNFSSTMSNGRPKSQGKEKSRKPEEFSGLRLFSFP